MWRLPQAAAAASEESAEAADETRVLQSSAGKRPILRHCGSARAMEIDLSKEEPRETRTVEGKGELVADLTTHGQRFVLCKGGRGGLGNRNFATATRQTPRFAQPGEPGEEGEFLLELRIMAEVELVGYKPPIRMQWAKPAGPLGY